MLLLAAEAPAQSAAEITSRGKSLEAILQPILYPDSNPERAVLLVIDPSRALRTTSFTRTLAKLTRGSKVRNEKLRLGIAVIGAKKGDKPLLETLPPGSDLFAIRRRANEAMMQSRNVVRDVYTPLRKLVPLFAREPSHRTIVLFSHQNGDTEYKLEKVIAALNKAKIRVVVVTREVLLSDSYWYRSERMRKTAPKRAYLASSEAAFVEVPWGWIYQRANLTNVAGSGFGTWGLSRLAAGTGGRVEILYTTESARHTCAGRFYGCPFCDSMSHQAPLHNLLAIRMKAIEPPLEPRSVVCKRAARDPYYKAVLRAWKAAHKADLIYERPAMRNGGGGLVQDWDRKYEGLGIYFTDVSNWSRSAQSARRRATAANRIATSLRKSIAVGDKSDGNPRYRAIAELTYVMLRLTRLNLLYLEAFYRDVAPRLVSKKSRHVEPPEVPVIHDPDRLTGVGLAWETYNLCHGVEPFLNMKLPGGNGLDFELRAFQIDYKTFLRRNAHTPYTVALSHMGIAVYSLRPFGKGNVKGATGAVKRKGTSSSKKKTTTEEESEPERGERGGGSSSGGTGSPTSGG